MKWGWKKPSSDSSPHHSWLTKFKQTTDKPSSATLKNNRKGNQSSGNVNPKLPKPNHGSAYSYSRSRYYTQEMAHQEEKTAALESFAVVKCSRNPKQDFRESMIEMIIEKRIRRPEELEELLACYLTLNADDYHGIIIKVFRQVWCELKEAYFNHKSPN